MYQQVETQYQYVMRKLNDKRFRIAEIAQELNMVTGTLYSIQRGKSENPSVHTIQALHDYFKKAGE